MEPYDSDGCCNFAGYDDDTLGLKLPGFLTAPFKAVGGLAKKVVGSIPVVGGVATTALDVAGGLFKKKKPAPLALALPRPAVRPFPIQLISQLPVLRARLAATKKAAELRRQGRPEEARKVLADSLAPTAPAPTGPGPFEPTGPAPGAPETAAGFNWLPWALAAGVGALVLTQRGRAR